MCSTLGAMTSRDSVYRTAGDAVLQLGEAVRRKARLQTQLAAVRAQHRDAQKELAAAKAQLASESADVERLEGRSLTWLLWSAIGQGEARLEKERAEAVQAELVVRAKMVDVEDAHAEVVRLQADLAPLEHVEGNYERAFVAKVERVVAAGGPEAQAIRARIAEVHASQRLLREIDEATEAGRLAERHLGEVLAAIKELEEEEVATMFVVTNVLITMAWGNPIAARLETHLRASQRHLRRYVLELKDIPSIAANRWHTSVLESFLPFLSGPDSDAARKAKDEIRTALVRVQQTQDALRHLRVQAAKQHIAAMHRYRAAVEHG